MVFVGFAKDVVLPESSKQPFAIYKLAKSLFSIYIRAAWKIPKKYSRK